MDDSQLPPQPPTPAPGPPAAPIPPAPQPAAAAGAPFYQIWILVLTRPREDTFQVLVDDPGSTFGRGALWIFISSLVGYLIAGALQYGQISAMMSSAEGLEGMGGAGISELATIGGLALLCIVPLVAAFSVAGLAISVGILQFVAGALGGAGSFRELYFATAAYTAPITLIGSVLGAIPLIGGCLALPLSVYSVYLNALAIKSVNRFGWGSTLITLFVPGIIAILLATVVFLLLFLPLLEGMQLNDFGPTF